MTQAYFDPKRASDPHALPDCEVFEYGPGDESNDRREGIAPLDCGWYWQACLPGCLPDGDPVGPFDSEADALADAREGMEDEPTCAHCPHYADEHHDGVCDGCANVGPAGTPAPDHEWEEAEE